MPALPLPNTEIIFGGGLNTSKVVVHKLSYSKEGRVYQAHYIFDHAKYLDEIDEFVTLDWMPKNLVNSGFEICWIDDQKLKEKLLGLKT